MAASGHGPADRVPPHNLEAEQSLLGSMFLSSEAVEVGLDVVSPDDFYRAAHAKIYTAIRDLYTRGEPVDQITVADRLESVGQLDQAGGKPYLLDITGMVPTAANASYYAEIVKRTSVLRQLISAGTDIVTLGYDSVEDLDAAIEMAEKTVFDVTNKRVSSNFRTLNELMTVGFEQIEQLYDRKEHITGVPTGFPDLDAILAGMHAGDLIILAARPSVGKTAFALNIAVEAAKKQFPVAVFSLEMSSEQLVQRILCAEARIDSQRLRTGYLNESDWPQIMQAMGRMNDAPLWVDDTPSISIIEVRAKARRLFRDKKQGLIIIDYLQLMQPQNRRSENRQVEIADISRGLKILAKELQVPIVALSQLSRAVEQRTSKRPMLSDLRECVTGETLVTLADGRRAPIRSLVGSTPEVLAVDERGRIVSAFSDAVWPVGQRAVYRVTLASGRVIRATGKHRLLTGRGWVRLAELELADRIATARRLPEPRETLSMSENRLALLGHLIGDGSYLSGQPMRYTTASEDNSQIVSAAAQEFGCTVSRHAGRGNWHQLVISGNGNRWHPAGVNAWLRDLGVFGQRSHEKRVPEIIFHLSAPQIAVFLRHLWATDGSIWVSRKAPMRARVFFSTCSRGLIEDVASLLLRLGIVSRIRTVTSGDSLWYTVDVSGSADQRRFLAAVGAFGPRQEPAERLSAMLDATQSNTNVDTLPHEVFAEVRSAMSAQGVSTRAMAAARGTSYGGSAHFAFAPSRSTVADYADRLDDDRLRDAASSDLFWDAIRTIEPDGVEEVYDLTVPGPASWLADGIVSHNSGAIEQDADVVMFIHRDTIGAGGTTTDDYGNEKPSGMPSKGEAEIIVAKHRNGPVDSCFVAYLDRYTKFVPLAKNVP